MSIVGSLIPAASAQALHGAQSTPVARADAANAVAQQAVTSGQAAVVHLSSTNPKRVASHGESKSVDAAFEKQEAKENVDKKVEKEKKTAGGAVDVSA